MQSEQSTDHKTYTKRLILELSNVSERTTRADAV